MATGSEHPTYPSLYQVNTRVWLTDLSRQLRRHATLDDVPEIALERFADLGFDWLWLLGVWQTGAAGARISRTNPEWRHEFEQTLPDLQDRDIAGSCFAITGYDVHVDLGGDAALARLRERMKRHGLRLMLDFVPNHTAVDHPWIAAHPDYYVYGDETLLARQPQNYFRASQTIFAHGRDPYFPGWPDTAQLNYGNPALQQAMQAELVRVAERCDGVRCDMAMLNLPDVFERTWGIAAEPFWPRTTAQVRRAHPQFVFMAEVYWDLEWTLQQQGFDFTYDKRLYDRLRDRQTQSVHDHLRAGLDYQNRLARFLENHDEPRAAATFPHGIHQAAACLTFLTPGLRFMYQGELDGRTKRISPHLVRAPAEPADTELQSFYTRLLGLLKYPAVRRGEWQLLDCASAWEGNTSSNDFIACTWHADGAQRLVMAVNFAPHPSQCFVHLPAIASEDGSYRLTDLMSPARYDRSGRDLAARGLYLDVPAWHYHVFEVARRP